MSVLPALRLAALDHRNPAIAARIHAVLMLAYAQEAALLQIKHFAPLQRTMADVQATSEFHLGALRGEDLLGVVSLGPDDEPEQINVAMLVVHPAHQRQRVARALMQEALRRGPGMAFSVSTAARNAPALALYRELGFVPYRWGTLGRDAMPVVKLQRPP